ncbi:MAG: UPF0175 family protein [Candidatus Contendobacter sp.]
MRVVLFPWVLPRLAKLDKWTFLEGLAERKIERHYGEDELEEDINYANTRSE